MTKEVGYTRKPASKLAIYKIRYPKYPKIYELLKNRYITYNETVQFLEEKEKEGSVFVIRPQKASQVGRIEKDRAKLETLYEEGYNDAKRLYGELIEYLEK